MLNRPPFWLGLLLGACAAFRLRFFSPRLPSSAPPDFRDLIADACIVCDSTGAVVEANATARTLFGLACTVFPSLWYPTGQRVSPGQHPLRRALETGETVSGRYCFTSADGCEHVVDIAARPLPSGKAAVVARDVTAQCQSETQQQAALARQAVVQNLCRRLRLARSAEVIGQAVAEETHALLAVPELQVRVYRFDPLSDTLTCLGAAPDDRPKHPKPVAEARAATARFDAQIPELWQMYIAREPSQNGFPLISGGLTIGHLSVTSTERIFDDAELREALELIASLAAFALAGPAASASAAALAAQGAAVREIAQAVGSGSRHDSADKAIEAVKRLTQAEVCTVSVPHNGTLCVIGKVFEDDLLVPQTVPDDPRLHGKAVQKAWKTQKTVTHLGLANPSLETGLWRAFAGSAGRHSVTAVPLAQKCGVLAVYTSGDTPLPDAQVRFLETLAALLSLSPAISTMPEGPAGL